MMAYDHVVKCPHVGREPRLAGPYTEGETFHDPFVPFGFAAGISETLEFVTGVLVLPQRQTALVAQRAADVDLLSRERLRLALPNLRPRPPAASVHRPVKISHP